MTRWLPVVLFASLLAACLAGCSDSGDNECAECRDEKCLDLVRLCEKDDDCACMSDCLGDNGIPGVQDCLDECGLDERPPNFGDVEACVAAACPDSGDECSTPSGYEPPDKMMADSCEPRDEVSSVNEGMTVDCSFGASDSCTECQAEKCCDLLELCSDNGDCACMALCTGDRGLADVDGCLEDCSLTGSPPGFIPLAKCVAAACPDGDECFPPPGFTPPDPVDSGGGASDGSIASGDLPDCAFDPDMKFDALGDVLQLEGAGGDVCLRLERSNEGRGNLANTNFKLLNMRVGPPGEVVLIDETLCWYSSHHNFADWVHGSSDGRHYDVELRLSDHGGVRTYFLHTFEEGSADAADCAPLATGTCAIGDVIELVPVNP